MSRTPVILAALAIAVIGIILWYQFRVPPGVTPQGDSTETVAWIGLATGTLGFLTALVGFVQKIVELRAK